MAQYLVDGNTPTSKILLRSFLIAIVIGIIFFAIGSFQVGNSNSIPHQRGYHVHGTAHIILGVGAFIGSFIILSAVLIGLNKKVAQLAKQTPPQNTGTSPLPNNQVTTPQSQNPQENSQGPQPPTQNNT